MSPNQNNMFRNRRDAGQQLAERLAQFIDTERDALIIALPRGGVPVAAEIAKQTGLPLDIITVRKIGVPGNEELAMGAIGSGGVRVLNPALIAQLGVSSTAVEKVIQRETRELERREILYRNERPPPQIAGRTVIVVDDGIATGSTMSASIRVLRQLKAGRIIVAVPVAPKDTIQRLQNEADAVVCALEPEPFYAVGIWYDDFSQTTDEEVRTILAAVNDPAMRE